MRNLIVFLLLFQGFTVSAKSYDLEITFRDLFENVQPGLKIELEFNGKTVNSGVTNGKGIVLFKDLKLKKMWINVIESDTVSNYYYLENKKRKSKHLSLVVKTDVEKYNKIITPLIEAHIKAEMKKFGYNSYNELPDSTNCDGEDQFPDQNASFYKGNVKMMQFIQQTITYPAESIANDDQGKVYISFIVRKDGTITDILIERGLTAELDREAKRVIRLMPKWIPAFCEGVPMDIKCRLPIVFTLQ